MGVEKEVSPFAEVDASCGKGNNRTRRGPRTPWLQEATEERNKKIDHGHSAQSTWLDGGSVDRGYERRQTRSKRDVTSRARKCIVVDGASLGDDRSWFRKD